MKILTNDLQKILKNHELSLCEYHVMTCPDYGIYCDPKNASIETVLLVDSKDFTADDYLSAIEELINRGLLKLAEQDYVDTKSTIPTAEILDIKKGDVVFSDKGFEIHRSVLKELYGKDFITKKDAFDLVDEENQVVNYFANTKELCDEWLFDMQQKTVEPSIDSYVGGLAEIVRIVQPKKIGQWQPNQFTVYDQGYTCSIYYKRLEIPSFTIESLELEAKLLSLEPIEISGSFQGNEFNFFDMPRWQPEKGTNKLTDDCATFAWQFDVYDEPRSSNVTPDNAHLKGELKTERGYVIPHYKFELSEEDERQHMLSLEQAKTILEQCCQHYLNKLTNKET